MTDNHKNKSRNKAQWLPLFDNRTKEFLANQNFKPGSKFLAIAAISSCLIFASSGVFADTNVPRGLPTANTTYSHYALPVTIPSPANTLPTVNADSIDPTNVATTGASSAFPAKQREAYFDSRTLTLRQAAPVLKQNNPARADLGITRERRPNYFNGDSGIPTDFSR